MIGQTPAAENTTEPSLVSARAHLAVSLLAARAKSIGQIVHPGRWQSDQKSRSAAQSAVLILASMGITSDSRLIDALIQEPGGWKSKTFSQLRVVIMKADAAMIEEVKWRKPSRPNGVPVWSHDGIVCIGETLKNAVRLSFPKGAQINDPKKLFNARLDSNTVRAIDFYEAATVDETALKALIVQAVGLNSAKARAR
jgi:hypothetical protein